jgi:NAD(P)-dependent dehydrogenase (short-subunit alcohol dehydrogenase family)
MGQRMQGKVAMVVGAGQTPGETVGNGRATALLYAREGATVMLVDNRLESAQETQTMIEKEGGKAFSHRADITRAADCVAMVEACVKAQGRIDVVTHVVGVSGEQRGILNITEADWDRILNVNLKGAFLVAKAVAPQLIKQESGVLLFVSSIAAITSQGYLAYKSSKAGLNALAHALALQLAPHGVRVNAIMPGLMDTPMAIENQARLFSIDKNELRERRANIVPLQKKQGTGWDVGYAALFLASDEARYITGVMLPVDGGIGARVGEASTFGTPTHKK